MEILNETVYDTGDLVAFITKLRDLAHRWNSAESLSNWQRYGQKNGTPYRPPVPKLLPETLRIGYYSKPTLKDEKEVRWTSYTRFRIGIIRPEAMPFVAMQIIALSAAEKDERYVADEVRACLAARLLRGMFHQYSFHGKIEGALAELPQIRWDDNPNREDVKASKAAAKQQSLESARKKLQWAEHDARKAQETLEKKLRALERARARLAKLEGRDVQEFARG